MIMNIQVQEEADPGREGGPASRSRVLETEMSQKLGNRKTQGRWSNPRSHGKEWYSQ